MCCILSVFKTWNIHPPIVGRCTCIRNSGLAETPKRTFGTTPCLKEPATERLDVSHEIRRRGRSDKLLPVRVSVYADDTSSHLLSLTWNTQRSQ